MIRLQSASCDICGTTGSDPLFTVSNYDIVQCVRCGLLYVTPLPVRDEIVARYKADPHWGGNPQRRAEAGSRFLYAQVLRLLPRAGEVLDIGCSFGAFLDRLRQAGHMPSGIELSAAAAAAARSRGFTVCEEPVGDVRLETGRFSAVTMLNVIEHLDAPLKACHRILQSLRPGGVLVLVTPNTAFALPFLRAYASLSGSKDLSSGLPLRISQLHPPNHLYFYTAPTIRNLLLRAGFVSCRVRNALPILNPSWFRTLAKWVVWGAAEIGYHTTRGHWLGGHSLLAWGYKPDELGRQTSTDN
jgi:SAM-dependent methyltransferase